MRVNVFCDNGITVQVRLEGASFCVCVYDVEIKIAYFANVNLQRQNSPLGGNRVLLNERCRFG
jgi:hypothetical protein